MTKPPANAPRFHTPANVHGGPRRQGPRQPASRPDAQAPRQAWPPAKKRLRLELATADVGLVGFPNAGKHLDLKFPPPNLRLRIAFMTLEPTSGGADGRLRSYVVADIPYHRGGDGDTGSHPVPAPSSAHACWPTRGRSEMSGRDPVSDSRSSCRNSRVSARAGSR